MNYTIVWVLTALSSLAIILSIMPPSQPEPPPPDWEWTMLPGTLVVVPTTDCWWWWRPYYTNRRIGVGTDG